MSAHEFEIEINDRMFVIEVDISWTYIDDSFDGHLGGRVHTFRAGHWEPEDFEIYSCKDENGDVEPSDVPGLEDAISSRVAEAEHRE